MLFVLGLLVHFNSLFVDVLLLLLLKYQFIGGFIKLIDVIAEVLWGSQLEQIGIECWHLRLDMVEKVGLHKVATVNSNGDLFKELVHCHIL